MLKDKNCAIHLIIKLILLNPGSIESFPKMGIGLVQNWRYMSEDDVPKLKETMEHQISTYLPHLTNVQMDLKLDNNKILYTSIMFNGEAVILSSNLETKEIKLINL